eukprot:g32984.t1
MVKCLECGDSAPTSELATSSPTCPAAGSRCHRNEPECDFLKSKSDKLKELVITSTPIKAFRKDLLDNDKDPTIDTFLEDRHKYEAVVCYNYRVGCGFIMAFKRRKPIFRAQGAFQKK